MAFSPDLVHSLLQKLKADNSGSVLDPFCGTGTTIVESKGLGIPAIGIDSSPFCAETSWAKTYWDVSPERLERLSAEALAGGMVRKPGDAFDAWEGLTVIDRGWLSRKTVSDALSLLESIDGVARGHERKMLRLAAVWAVKEWSSNVRFGPEAYRVTGTRSLPVEKAFKRKVGQMVSDLRGLPAEATLPAASLHCADSRNICETLAGSEPEPKWVITSPPYPTEHDYTRIMRIELELSGHIRSREELRAVKEQMLRSNSKNVYAGDNDYEYVRSCNKVRRLVERIQAQSKTRNYGFARQYPRVVAEYFGGIYRHMKSLADCLPEGARCAYVLGEQRSYFGTLIPTPRVFAHLCSSHGLPFRATGLQTVKTRIATRGTRARINEQVVFLKRT